MSESQPPANDDLMQALESLRNLLDKDEASANSIDIDAIPTLDTPVSAATPAAPVLVENDAVSDSSKNTTKPEKSEQQLSFSELSEPSSSTTEKPSPSTSFEEEFQEFWDIFKPKLKRAIKQSYKELHNRKNS